MKKLSSTLGALAEVVRVKGQTSLFWDILVPAVIVLTSAVQARVTYCTGTST